jgi:hypothetical protein
MKNAILLLFSLLLLQNVHSQTGCCPYLQKTKTIPAFPTINDSVKIIIDAVTPGLGGKIGTNYSFASDTINVEGCYYDGIAAQPLEIIDTINIGILPLGTYIINFTGYLSNRIDSCVRIDGKSISDTFKVSEISNIIDAERNYFAVNISPNPVIEKLRISTNQMNYEVEIYDLSGRIFAKNVSNEQIDVSNLPIGIYFLRFRNEKVNVIKKFVKE